MCLTLWAPSLAFRTQELLQRELICAFFLAFSAATLTGLQRGNLPVATFLLGNKRSDLVHLESSKDSFLH